MIIRSVAVDVINVTKVWPWTEEDGSHDHMDLFLMGRVFFSERDTQVRQSRTTAVAF